MLREGLQLVGLGIGIGVAAALVLTRFLETLLFGVAARDMTTFVLASGILLERVFWAAWRRLAARARRSRDRAPCRIAVLR